MSGIRRIRNRFSPTARVGHALAGAVLLVLPALIVYREGGDGVTPGLIISALFGVAYLVAAALGAATRTTSAGMHGFRSAASAAGVAATGAILAGGAAVRDQER
jgi:hypothetical protein